MKIKAVVIYYIHTKYPFIKFLIEYFFFFAFICNSSLHPFVTQHFKLIIYTSNYNENNQQMKKPTEKKLQVYCELFVCMKHCEIHPCDE